MSSPTTAVLAMAYGTPRHPDEIEAYYTHIRRGRPPTPEALADLVARYDAIGGLSPLAALTEAQRDALGAALDAAAPGHFEVAIGLKHAHPMIEETVAELAERGITRIIGLVLAPHFSTYSIGQYLGRAREAAEPHGIEVLGVESWATEPAFVEFLARDVRTKLDAMTASDTSGIIPAGNIPASDVPASNVTSGNVPAGNVPAGNIKVVFTAHSLPQRIIDGGDPYPDELRATAAAVAEAAGLGEWSQWSIAWQSAGRTPEPWIGPDILEVIDDLGATHAADGIIVSACGFVADHLEVLYDLDIEARQRAEAIGLRFARTECVNADPVVMGALAGRILELDRA